MMKRKFSDEQILEGIRKGKNQRKIFAQLYAENYPLILSFVKQNNGTEEDAKDLLQEVLVVFQQNVLEGKFRGDSKVSTYLYSIYRYKWKDHNNSYKAKKQREIAYSNTRQKFQEDVSSPLEFQDAKKSLLDVFGQLGKKCAELVRLSFYEDYKADEIMESLEYESVQSVRNAKAKCLARLKAHLEKKPMLKQYINNLLKDGI